MPKKLTKLAKSLRTWRQYYGLSQRELGEKMDLSEKTISSWEVGRTEPNMGNLEQLSEIFGCSMQEILNNEDPEDVFDKEIFNMYDKAVISKAIGEIPENGFALKELFDNAVNLNVKDIITLIQVSKILNGNYDDKPESEVKKAINKDVKRLKEKEHLNKKPSEEM